MVLEASGLEPVTQLDVILEILHQQEGTMEAVRHQREPNPYLLNLLQPLLDALRSFSQLMLDH